MTISIQQLFALPFKQILLALAGIFLLCGMAQAAQVTLAWDKVNDSTITGYRIYYGTQSSKYTDSVDAGNTTQYTISGLDYGTTYYFVAVSYTSTGEKSGYSNEVSQKIALSSNSAPKTPVLKSGSSGASVNATFTCTATATDPEGNALQYRFDWDDGTVSSWGGGSQSHVWKNPGEYCVKGQAKDSQGALSGWSACLSVTVTSTDSTDGAASSGGSTGDDAAASGGSSDGAMNSTDTGENGTVKLWLETEDGDITAPMEIADDPTAAGGLYIGVPDKYKIYRSPDLAAGYADFVFQAPQAGYYLIWGRVLAPSGGDDSFYVSMDDAAFFRWNPTVGSSWHWQMIASGGSGPWKVYLTAGLHTLTLLCREDGTRIDRLFITNDMNYTPSGQGEAPPVQGDTTQGDTTQGDTTQGDTTQGDTTQDQEDTGASSSAPDRIWLESEDADIVAPMEIQSDAAAAGGLYIGVPDKYKIYRSPDFSAGYADFVFQAPQAGYYLIWGRVLAPSGGDDSFYVSMDDAAFFRWNPTVGSSWHWQTVASGGSGQWKVYLTAGLHTLTLLCREDGTKIDKVLITSDTAYTPQGQGGEADSTDSNTNTSAGADASTDSGISGDAITIEAEKGVCVGSMVAAAATDASAGQYVWVPDGSGNKFSPDPKAGSVTFSFTVPQAGDYVVWGRELSSNYGNDSFFAAMDGDSPFRWNTQVANSWTWNQVNPVGNKGPKVWHLSAGTHKLVLMLREDGTKLDKVVITSDLTAVPAD